MGMNGQVDHTAEEEAQARAAKLEAERRERIQRWADVSLPIEHLGSSGQWQDQRISAQKAADITGLPQRLVKGTEVVDVVEPDIPHATAWGALARMPRFVKERLGVTK